MPSPLNVTRSLENRANVELAVGAFFGASIFADERVWQTLEETCSFGGDNQTYVLLESIIRCVPAAAGILSDLGIDVSRIGFPYLPAALPSSLVSDHTSAVLGQAFLEDFFDSRTLNPTAIKIREAQRLTIHDLLRGPLESPYNWPDLVPQTMLSSLLIAAGIRPLTLSREQVCAEAAMILSRLAEMPIIDNSAERQQFLLSWDGDRFRIRPFGAWGSYQFASDPLPNGSLWVARGNVIEPSSRFSEGALAELEHLIAKDAGESDFQKFFERNPEFLLTLGDYTQMHAQLVIHEDNGNRLIPDFFLEKINSDFCDICDLKRPTRDLIRLQKNRHRFRDAIMEGVAQLRVYRDWFEDREHRSKFKTRYGLNGYRPEAVLIIGRRQNYFDEVERIQIESDLPSWVRLRTYDDVVAKARHWRNLALSPSRIANGERKDIKKGTL